MGIKTLVIGGTSGLHFRGLFFIWMISWHYDLRNDIKIIESFSVNMGIKTQVHYSPVRVLGYFRSLFFLLYWNNIHQFGQIEFLVIMRSKTRSGSYSTLKTRSWLPRTYRYLDTHCLCNLKGGGALSLLRVTDFQQSTVGPTIGPIFFLHKFLQWSICKISF